MNANIETAFYILSDIYLNFLYIFLFQFALKQTYFIRNLLFIYLFIFDDRERTPNFKIILLTFQSKKLSSLFYSNKNEGKNNYDLYLMCC